MAEHVLANYLLTGLPDEGVMVVHMTEDCTMSTYVDNLSQVLDFMLEHECRK